MTNLVDAEGIEPPDRWCVKAVEAFCGVRVGLVRPGQRCDGVRAARPVASGWLRSWPVLGHLRSASESKAARKPERTTWFRLDGGAGTGPARTDLHRLPSQLLELGGLSVGIPRSATARKCRFQSAAWDLRGRDEWPIQGGDQQ
jgi:hypothetical protein